MVWPRRKLSVTWRRHRRKRSESEKSKDERGLDGLNRQSPIASVQRTRSTLAIHYFRSSMWNEYYTNERQSRDSNRSATNAGSTRTKLCVFRGRDDRQRSLVIRITATTLTSDSAITIARFRLSKDERPILKEDRNCHGKFRHFARVIQSVHCLVI